MKTKIIEVQSKKELKQFTHLPAQIYKNDHIWVNSVSLIDKKLFKSISHNNYKLFLALKDNKPAGRIAAFTDDNYDKKWTQERIGFWGSFESIKDYDVAEQLFESARSPSNLNMTCLRYQRSRQFLFLCFLILQIVILSRTSV